MAENCFIEHEPSPYVRLTNSTGADLVADELCVINGKVFIAIEPIASGDAGTFMRGGGAIIQASDFVTDEGTFGTDNATVYFDSTTKKFSDTSTEGYYAVGLVANKLSNSVIRVLTFEEATVVPAA